MTWQPTETGFVQLDGERIVSSLVRTDAGFTLYDHESTNDAETTPKVFGSLVSADTERLNWLDGISFTAYRSFDPEFGELHNVCLVDEGRAWATKSSRTGIVEPTIRQAIDAAKGQA